MSTSGYLSSVRPLRAASRSLRQCLQWVGQARVLDQRIAASITLAGVAISASAGFMVAPRSSLPAATVATTTTSETRVAATDVSDQPRGPVKILGGAPRGETCAEQVWPYIERRCLTLAAEKGPTISAPSSQIQEGRATASLETMVVASADDAQADSPSIARRRSATSYLTLPPRDSFSQTDGWSNPSLEQPTVGKPRQRAGRRAYRSRYGGSWGWRHSFGSIF
jgi:hypothetical protein